MIRFLTHFAVALNGLMLLLDLIVAGVAFTHGGSPPTGTVISAVCNGAGFVYFLRESRKLDTPGEQAC